MSKEPFIQKFMRLTDKLKIVLGPADRDYNDIPPTEEDFRKEAVEEKYAAEHWEQHQDSKNENYASEKPRMVE